MFVGVTLRGSLRVLGGKMDDVMQRFIEILNGIPNLVVAILAMVVFKPGILTISIAIGRRAGRPWRGSAGQDAAAEGSGVHPRLTLSGGERVPAPVEAPDAQLAGADHHQADVHHPGRDLRRGVSELYRAWDTGAEGLSWVAHSDAGATTCGSMLTSCGSRPRCSAC